MKFFSKSAVSSLLLFFAFSGIAQANEVHVSYSDSCESRPLFGTATQSYQGCEVKVKTRAWDVTARYESESMSHHECQTFCDAYTLVDLPSEGEPVMTPRSMIAEDFAPGFRRWVKNRASGNPAIPTFYEYIQLRLSLLCAGNGAEQ